MADETTPQTAPGGDDVDPNLPLGDGHSVVLDDEELHEQLPDESNADERTALTAAHQGARASEAPLSDIAPLNTGDDFALSDGANGTTHGQTVASAHAFGDALQDGLAGATLFGSDSVTGFVDGTASPEHGGDANATHAPVEHGAFGVGNDGSAIGDLPFDAFGAGATPADSSTDDSQTSFSFTPVAELPGTVEPPVSFGNSDAGADADEADNGDGDTSNQFNAHATDTVDLFSTDSATDQTSAGVSGGGGGVNPIIGDRFDNNLVGTDGRDMINAQDGNDFASGGAGDDLIMGKKGDDTLEGGLGNDTLRGGHGDDTFVFSDADFDGNAWTDVVDGQGQSGKPNTDYDTIDLTNVSQGWTLEVDGAGAGPEATDASHPAQYTQTGDEFSGTITFDDGSTVTFDHIERIDW